MTTTTDPRTATLWHLGPLLGFDIESTGVDVELDRIVTTATVLHQPGQERITTNRLANPGIDIPEGATAVHGITTAHAIEHGRPAHEVIQETRDALAEAMDAGSPVAGANLVYDFTLLDRECRRHGVQPLTNIAPVIDVMVIDKAIDRYRRGSRKLVDLSALYGVQLLNAHDSDSDATAALDIALAIAARVPQLRAPAMNLHRWQIGWRAEQMASFAQYRRSKGEPLDDEDGSWPIKPYRGTL